MNVETIMTRNPRTCTEEDRLADAARLMWEHDCGAVPVTTADGTNRLVGMVTDRDACMSALFNGAALHQLRVADAMSRSVMTCKPTDSLLHAAALLRETQVRRLPVVDAQGNVVGLLALADLARASVTSEGKAEITAPNLVDTLAAITKSSTEAAATAPKKPIALLPK